MKQEHCILDQFTKYDSIGKDTEKLFLIARSKFKDLTKIKAIPSEEAADVVDEFIEFVYKSISDGGFCEKTKHIALQVLNKIHAIIMIIHAVRHGDKHSDFKVSGDDAELGVIIAKWFIIEDKCIETESGLRVR